VSRIVTVILLVVVMAFSYFAFYNQEIVTVTIWGSKSMSLPLVGVVLFSMGIGAAIVLLMFGLRGLAKTYTQVQDGMKNRRRAKAEDLYNKGVDAHLSGKWANAVKLLEDAVQKDSDFLLPFFRLGTIYMEQGKVDEAIELHQKALAGHPGNLRVRLMLVDDYLAANKLDDAAEVLNEIVKKDDGNKTALMLLREIQEQQDDWDNASDTQKKLIKIARNKDEARSYYQGLRYECAVTLMGRGETDKAVKVLRDILKEAPDFIAATVSLGVAHILLGKLDEGLKVLEDGYKRHKNPVFLQVMEDQLLEKENPRKLIETFRSLLDRSPKDIYLNLFYGKSCLRLEMVDEGYMALKKVESMGYDMPLLHALLGKANAKRERYEEAIGEYRKYMVVVGGASPMFVCDNCGHTEGIWSARCESCSMWNSFALPDLVEVPVQPAAMPQYESEE